MWDLVSQPGTGMEPGPLHAEYRILACEPPGKSLWVLLWPPPTQGEDLVLLVCAPLGLKELCGRESSLRVAR